MKNEILLIIIGMNASIGLVACESKDEVEPPMCKFELIEFKADGAELTDHFIDWGDGTTSKESQCYGVNVPADGMSFTLAGVGKNANEAYITQLLREEDEPGHWVLVEPAEEMPSLCRPADDNIPRWEGEWGSIEYVSPAVPYVVRVSLAPNNTGEERKFRICFSRLPHTVTSVVLTQPSVWVINSCMDLLRVVSD